MVGQVDPFASVRRKMVVARIEFMGRLAAFKRAQLTCMLASDEPSALQIAYHLYVIDGLVLQQMRRVQVEDDPQLLNPVALPESYHGEQTVQPPTELTLDTILAGMAARREAMFSYLAKLSPDTWERTFHFQDAVPMRFYQLCNLLPLHDQQHARQLESLKTRLDGTAPSSEER
jgi:hypothetical protein